MIVCARWTAILLVASAAGCSSSGNNNDGAADSGVDTPATNDAGGLPGFGQACAPIAQQGDPQCASGLVCVSVGIEQGRNLCTRTCTTEDAPCAGGPAGTAPTCGREYQVPSGVSRVCQFFCDASAPNCPPATTCLVDLDGVTTCQPPIQ